VQNDFYLQFQVKWNEYKKIVTQVRSLSSTDRKAEAIAMYRTTSRSTYHAASDALGLLTESTVAKGREASSRADAAYRQAQWLIGIAMAFAGTMVAAALIYVQRAISVTLSRNRR
jgi:hypothetical protein